MRYVQIQAHMVSTIKRAIAVIGAASGNACCRSLGNHVPARHYRKPAHLEINRMVDHVCSHFRYVIW
jgi:hypothetical protein